MIKRTCIVCGKPCKKRTIPYYVRAPREAVEAQRAGGFQWAAQPERPDGFREDSGWCVTLYLDNPPRSKEEAQRLANARIISTRKRDDGTLSQFTTWDGESYWSDWFHADRCAVAFAEAVAKKSYGGQP